MEEELDETSPEQLASHCREVANVSPSAFSFYQSFPVSVMTFDTLNPLEPEVADGEEGLDARAWQREISLEEAADIAAKVGVPVPL